jgi:hypothetical protein
MPRRRRLAMKADFLAARRSELTALAEERGVDWRQTVGSVEQEDDEVLTISALATLLELDISRVFNPQNSLEEVERDSRQLLESHTVEFEQQWTEIERQLRNLPAETKVKLAEQLEAAAAVLREG